MSDKTVAQKLLVKEGQRVLVINAPKGDREIFGVLPEGAQLLTRASGPADIVQVFVADRKDLEAQLAKVKPLVRPGGGLWVTYHKGTSKTRTDINRDSINAYARTLGLQGVAMISVDDDWSALRLKAA